MAAHTEHSGLDHYRAAEEFVTAAVDESNKVTPDWKYARMQMRAASVHALLASAAMTNADREQIRNLARDFPRTAPW